ncbi:MAG TPA: multicopper oxidase family protein [Phycisphaerales bacterium]|nr:multicopper oxidase family protein [Phycisphaerales bacterium]
MRGFHMFRITTIAVLLTSSSLTADLVQINMDQSISTHPILTGTETTTWRYTGQVMQGPTSALTVIPNSYLGPIIHVNTGDEVRIHMQNNLAYESTTHWHGLDIPDAVDGHPKDAMPAGGSYDYDFIVRNRAATYWYHPHPDMMTGEQVYRGLASFFIVSDAAEQALDLPRGEYDLPLCIQDATFSASNQLDYGNQTMSGFFGDTTLVNGNVNYNYSAATRIYRLRLLNGSQSRILKLAFSDGTPMVVIGVDGGLLEAPEEYPYLIMGPGERLEVWADFSNKNVGDVLSLNTLAFSDNTGPGQGVAKSLMTFTIDRAESETLVLPTTLVPMGEVFNAADIQGQKTWAINFSFGNFFINGGPFSMFYAASNEQSPGDALEMVTITNTSGMLKYAHPMHFHGRQFQIYSRSITSQGATGYNTVKDGLVDSGWQDTFVIMPYETVKYLVRWSRHPGLFMYHCHNLPHEDMGMMRNFHVLDTTCPSDLTHDAMVDVSDFLEVIANWGTPFGDVTGDDLTNVNDVLATISDWGICNAGFRDIPNTNKPTISLPSKK